MLTVHYTHRLPSNYDLSLIRERARGLAAAWDETPELLFKAFLLREQGRHGAAASSYSSLYLWRRSEAVRGFLAGGNAQIVAGSFGRPEINTRIVLEARRGPAEPARFLYVQDTDVAPDANLTEALASAAAGAQDLASRPDAVVSVAALDTARWRLQTVLISQAAPETMEGWTAFEVLHLSRPLLASLPDAHKARVAEPA